MHMHILSIFLHLFVLIDTVNHTHYLVIALEGSSFHIFSL